MDEKYNFQELANEAAESSYNPRAKRCWLLHDWTMWECVSNLRQERRCLGCGVYQVKPIARCFGLHHWQTVSVMNRMANNKKIGKTYHQECEQCAALRRVCL